MTTWRVDHIRLSSDPYTRGIQHGQQLGSAIRRLLADGCARLNLLLERPVPEDQLYVEALKFATPIEKELPSLSEELHGMAVGAGISYEAAVLLQVRREMLARHRPGIASDCSSLALPTRPPIVAQTIDLNGSFSEFGTVFSIAPWGGRPEILLYSFAGLLGYLGMNSHGLAVGINMVCAEGWQIGVPPYLLVRHLLELSSVEECLDAISRIPRSSSRCLLICDSRRRVIVEMTSSAFRVIEAAALYHTNHFLAEDMVPKDVSNFLVRGSSRRRLERLMARSMALPDTPTPAKVFGVFNDHEDFPVGLCSHAQGDLRRTETVATVVMLPTEGVMLVRQGLPCEARDIQRFELSRTPRSMVRTPTVPFGAAAPECNP